MGDWFSSLSDAWSGSSSSSDPFSGTSTFADAATPDPTAPATDTSTIFDTGPSSSSGDATVAEQVQTLPQTSQGASSPAVGGTLPIPPSDRTSGINVDPLKIFQTAASYGLQAVQSFNQLKIAQSQQKVDNALAQRQVAANAAAGESKLRVAAAKNNADALTAQLAAQAQVASAKLKAAALDPKTWVLVGIGSLAVWKLFFAKRALV